MLRTHTSPVQIRTMQAHGAAAADHRAGPRLSLRQRRHAHADVPSDRGAGDRPGDHARPSQVDARDLPQSLFRARRRRAPDAPELFPVHRAVGRGRCRLVDGKGPARGRRPGRLDGSAGQRHGPPARDRQLRARSRRMAGLRLRLPASTGWRCSNTAWTTCAPSSTAISAGSSITASARSTCPRCRAEWAHEVLPCLAEGASRHRRVRRGDRRQADQHRARGRGAVQSGRGARAVPRRQGADRRASTRRPTSCRC